MSDSRVRNRADLPDLASSFHSVAEEYDTARPSYPDALLDAVEKLSGRPLAGAEVLDVGAGTGIATRLLHARGARVTAVEPTEGMAAKLHAVTPRTPLVRGDGNALPFRDASADLITYAQAFHWTDWDRSVAEAARVLRPGGALAVWWNVSDHEQPWAVAQEARLRAACPGYGAYGIPLKVEAELGRRGLRTGTALLRWERRIPISTALLDLGSHSYVAVLGSAERKSLLAAEREALLAEFPDGTVVARYLVDLTVGIPVGHR
jgi:ubiquinone/menaquinone biosynthesis C-methylase UbiE